MLSASAMKWMIYTVVALTVLWVLGNLFTGPLQHWFIFRPKKLPQNHEYQFEAPFEELFIETSYRGRLNTLWFKASGDVPAKGLVLFYHGNAGSLERWGHLHHFFARYGYDFLVYDYRGYGKSTGKRSQKIMYDDAQEVYRFARKYYPPEQIVLYGRSLGSSFASRVAAEQPARILVLETPFYSMSNLFYTYYPFLPRAFYFQYNLSNARSLRQVQIPVVVFHGTDDLVVPYRCAERLKKVLKPGDQFYTIPGGSHNNLLFYDIYNSKMEEILSGEE
jgi:pimeloyl-ACP methyl ester carboxylesterase